MVNQKKMIVIICFFVLLLLILSMIYIQYQYTKFKNIFERKEEKVGMTYCRCNEKELGKITNDIFLENRILKGTGTGTGTRPGAWDIYVPCGYNNVEQELLTIQVGKHGKRFIFGVNGCDSIVSKNRLWELLLTTYGREFASQLMPESFSLDDPYQMALFKKQFSGNGEIYILKKNVQRKEGLKLTREWGDIIDAEKENYKVVQRYITDLYLIRGRKVNLRIYLLIVVDDEGISFYVSDKGKCIYTKNLYNDNDLDFESNITSYHLDMEVYKENPRDFDELRAYIDGNEGLGNSLYSSLRSGRELFDAIHLLFRDVCKGVVSQFGRSKNLRRKGVVSFQLFGADVIFNRELDPYLLEINKGPDMSARDELDAKMKKEVQEDMFRCVGIIHDGKEEGGEGERENSFHLIYEKKV